jgi:hypothetical protein
VGDFVSREGSDVTLHVERDGDYSYKVVLTFPPNEPEEFPADRPSSYGGSLPDDIYRGRDAVLSPGYIYFHFRDVDTMKMHFTSALDGSYVRSWFDRKQQLVPTARTAAGGTEARR